MANRETILNICMGIKNNHTEQQPKNIIYKSDVNPIASIKTLIAGGLSETDAKAIVGRNKASTIVKQGARKCIIGIDYADTEQGKTIIASGNSIGKLPFGNWKPNYEKFVIEYTGKDGIKREYLRYFPDKNSTLENTIYFLNGRIVTKQFLEQEHYIQKDTKKEQTTTPVNVVKFDNIMGIDY